MKKYIPLFGLMVFILLGLVRSDTTQAASKVADDGYTVHLPLLSRSITPTWLGPDGGKIIALAINPLNPNILYAGTWGSGIYKTTDAGQNWFAVNVGLGNKWIWSLGINPLQPDILYAGTDRGKLFKSSNGGSSWALASTGIQESAIVYAIAINPLDPNKVYIATRGLSNNGDAPWKGVIYRSLNAGASWQVALNDVPAFWQQDYAYAIAIHPTSPDILLAAFHEYGIYRSDNGGTNWYQINEGNSDWSARDVVIDAKHSPFYAYAGFWHENGILKSTNGVAWAFPQSPLERMKVWKLALDPNQPDTLYLATQSLDGILKTTDGGKSWIWSGLSNQMIWQVIVNPQDSRLLYSGTDENGVYRSLDSGGTWANSNKGIRNVSATGVVTLPGAPNTLYVSSLATGVFKTSNYGDIWEKYTANLADRSIHALVQHPTNADLVFALTNASGLFYTNIRSGTGWTAASSGLPVVSSGSSAVAADIPFSSQTSMEEAEEVYRALDEVQSTPYSPLLAMVFAPSNPSIAYLGTAGGGVFKSTNGGSSWSAAGLQGQSVWSLAVDPQNANLIYAATDLPGGVQVSRDGGATWQPLGIAGVTVNSLAFSTSPAGALYAGTNQGLYQYANGWVSRGLADQNVTVIKTHPAHPGKLFAGTQKGLFIYTEDGGYWNTGPTELTSHTIQGIDFDLNSPNRAYFSTNDQGILLALVP